MTRTVRPTATVANIKLSILEKPHAEREAGDLAPSHALPLSRLGGSHALGAARVTLSSMRAPATATVHVRVNERVKARAEKALAAMGLSVSDAVRVLLTRVAEEQAFPLELKVPNAKTRAAIEESRRGVGLEPFATVEELMANLNAPDPQED